MSRKADPLGRDKNAKLIAYGSFNVYEIGGKAYYHDPQRRVYIRAPERDYLIKGKGSQGVLQ